VEDPNRTANREESAVADAAQSCASNRLESTREPAGSSGFFDLLPPRSANKPARSPPHDEAQLAPDAKWLLLSYILGFLVMLLGAAVYLFG
jgi:hypothetical protein